MSTGSLYDEQQPSGGLYGQTPQQLFSSMVAGMGPEFNPQLDPTVSNTPGGGGRVTVADALAYIRYLALTGQLMPMASRGELDGLFSELGIPPNTWRQVRSALTVRLNLGSTTTRADAIRGGGGQDIEGGLLEGSIRAREGSSPEIINRQVSGGQAFGPAEIWMAPWEGMGVNDYTELQRLVYEAGFYDTETPPIFGDRSDPGFRAAWFRAVSELYASGNQSSMDEFLSQKAQIGNPLGDQSIQFDTEIIQLTDAAAIRSLSDELAQGELGRKLTDEQKATMVQLIHAAETSMQQQGIDVQTGNMLAEAGINMGTVAGNIDAAKVLQTGTALASQYGLTISSHIRTPEHNAAIGGARNSDHLTGMAVDLSGDPARMAALAAWAHANEGPGKLFRWVGWSDSDPSGGHDDHVHLSFNTYVGEGADIGASLGVSGGTASTGIDAFMAATRAVESGGDYGVTNSIGAYGAYQFMPGTWDYAARLAGINPSDRSPGAQDAAARALMSRYYQMYGDWRLVAVAWHGGEGLANAYKNNLAGLRGVGDGNISTYDYMNKVMSAMGSAASTGLPGPMTVPIQGVDVQARLEEELRRRFPDEAESHDIALQFEAFSNLAFNGLGSGMPI